MKCLTIIIISFLLVAHISAGPAGIACEVTCLSYCAASNLVGVQAFAACMIGCTVACAFFCFHPDSQISVMGTNNVPYLKSIDTIQAGDSVLTLQDGILVPTKVFRNVETKGSFVFLEVTLQNIKDKSSKVLKVIPEHGVVVKNISSGALLLTSALDLRINDSMIGAEDAVFMIMQLRQVFADIKYTLETTSGTVLVSDILTATLCSQEIGNRRVDLNQKMADWRKRRHLMENDIYEDAS